MRRGCAARHDGLSPGMKKAPPDATGFVARIAEPGEGPRVAVKDMIAVSGCLWTAGLAAHATRRATRDAAVVTRLRAAGYAIAGTTMTDNAGFGTMTEEVANPRFSDRAVGGSSGGAAAAVAAGAVELGLGTDTGGSIRIPAAYCGLWAFKASHGRLPMDGIIPLAPTFDAPGLLADGPGTLLQGAAALLEGAIPASAPAVRLGLDGDALRSADPAVLTPFAAIAARLGATATVAPVAPYLTSALAHAAVVSLEAAATYRDDPAWTSGDFEPDLLKVLEDAAESPPAAAVAARAEAAGFGAAYRQAMDAACVDIVLAPTLPMPPAARHDGTARIRDQDHPVTNANIRLTFMANLAGLPVVVAPIGALSVQFIGRPGTDEALLRHAATLAAEAEAGDAAPPAG
ncbi:MAG: amidase [Acuticoccus sp.]